MNVSTTVPPCVPVAVRVTNAVKRKELDIHKKFAKYCKLRFCIDTKTLLKCFSMLESSCFLK